VPWHRLSGVDSWFGVATGHDRTLFEPNPRTHIDYRRLPACQETLPPATRTRISP
jgi:hypothetical protein